MTGITSNTKWVIKTVRIPLELDAQLEALNINFSRFVREAIEEKLNGRKDDASKSILDYKVNELDEKLEQALSIISEVQEEQDKLRGYISTLKEQQQEHTKQEQQQKEEILKNVARDCRHFRGLDSRGLVICKGGGYPSPEMCTPRCRQYRRQGSDAQ